MADRNYDNLFSIIGGCIRKDGKAQEILYKQYFGYAMSVALLYSSNRNDAIEIVNDSFMKVFSELKSFDTSRPFKGWLRRIVINTAIDKFRKSARTAGFRDVDQISAPDPAPGVISNLTARDIISLLNTLPHIYKTVFCLFDIEGYSHEEIAGKLKIPESTSRVYLIRARKKMKDLYNKHIDEDRTGKNSGKASSQVIISGDLQVTNSQNITENHNSFTENHKNPANGQKEKIKNLPEKIKNLPNKLAPKPQLDLAKLGYGNENY
ncbi:MAG: RNA polymerase sigma factor [Bacteroidales bacterium]